MAIVKNFSLGHQLARFGLIGVFTVALDFGLLYFLTSVLSVHYLTSTFLAFLIASAVNYLLSIQFVFDQGRHGISKEYAMFLVTTLVGLGINQLAMWSLVSLAEVRYLPAKVFSLGVVTVWNFLSKKRLVFLR